MSLQSNKQARNDRDANVRTQSMGKRESSGLHDIRELARSTRQRIAVRASSESDLEDSLLSSTEMSLSFVALPEVGAEPPAYATAEPEQESAAVTTTQVTRKGVPLWAFLLVAAAATVAIALLLLRPAQQVGGQPVSKTAWQQAVTPPSPPTQANSAVAVKASQPTIANVEPTADPATELAGSADAIDPAAANSDKPTGSEAVSSGQPTRAQVAGAGTPATNVARSPVKKPAVVKATGTKPVASAPVKTPTTPKPTPATKKEPSMDDLLAEALGERPTKTKKAAVKKPEKKVAAPSKTSLDRDDIKGSMRKITGRVQACFSQHKVPGIVNVGLTVNPTGGVSKAKAKGSFAGTPTGTCVANAVKSAKFPAWAGAPKSFSFPFRLSE